MGGLGNKRVRANSPIRFHSEGNNVVVLTFDPKGLVNRSVEFPRSSTYADGGKGRTEDSKRRQMTACSDEDHLHRTGPCIRGVLCAGQGKCNSENAKAEKMADRLGDPPT